MSTLTSRLLVPIPALTDSADLPAAMTAVWAVLDPILAVISKGTLAARPAAGSVSGKLYYATDTGGFYVSDGTTWQFINPFPASDAAAATPSLRSLGTGATQAAAGNDARLSDTRTPTAGSVGTTQLASGAVVWSKIGSQSPLALSKVGTTGAGLTTAPTYQRAGRQLARADFTTLLGAAEPRLLMNMTTSVDSSVAPNTITVVGTITPGGTINSGIEGLSGTALLLDGNTQYMTGPNTLKQKYGTWGGWFKCTQRALTGDQAIFSQWQAASTDVSFRAVVDFASGKLRADLSTSGAALVGVTAMTQTVVADDQWHFFMVTYDGARLNIFLDGVMEATSTQPLSSSNGYFGGPAFQSAALVMGIGASSNGTLKFQGKLDELFITGDVLGEESGRLLYARKLTHTLGTQPELIITNVKKFHRSKSYVASDFTNMNNGSALVQPLIGSNLESTTFVNDYGSLVKTMTGTVAGTDVPDPQSGLGGSKGWWFDGTNQVNGSDASLPSGSAGAVTLSYGMWVRCFPPSGQMTLLEWGTASAAAGRELIIDASAALIARGAGGGTCITQAVGSICDGEWHFVVVTENPNDLVPRRIYVDGALASVAVAGTLNALTLSGATGLRLGNDLGGGSLFKGFIGGFFITNSWLTSENVRELYNKTSAVVFADRLPMDHTRLIERADSSALYLIADELEPTDSLEVIIV